MFLAPPPPRIDLAAGVLALQQKLKDRNNNRHTILAMYSSVLGGITTEPALFTVPLDDHMVHRGHGVFDTCSVKQGRAYALDMHLDRFLLSAKTCRIDPVAFSKDELRAIILHTLAVGVKESNNSGSIYCRFWMSAGRGDFYVAPPASVLERRTEFYCVVHTMPSPTTTTTHAPMYKCIKEVSVSVPVKCKFLATSKTNNYLVNALAAMEAEERGGTLGLQCQANGNVAECSIGSVAFVFAGDGQVIRTPKLDCILRSTTLLRAEALWKNSSSSFVFEDLPLSVVLERAVEAIGFGGSNVTCITELDGKQIGTGVPGPVFRQLHSLLEQDFATLSHELPLV